MTQEEFDQACLNSIDIHDFLYGKLATDRHMHTNYVVDYLSAPKEGKEKIYHKLLSDIRVLTDQEEIRKATIEKLLIELTQDRYKLLTTEKKLEAIETVKTLLDPTISEENEVIHDLENLEKYYTRKMINIEGYTIELSSDPIDIMLCGTEVDGSYQRVTGNGRTNRGLLGYLLDGKNMVAVVKDTEGKIVSRSLVRLMWNDVTSEPVLLLSRIYGIKAFEKAFVKLAKIKAEAMQIPLVSVEVGNPTEYPKPYPDLLQGKGGPAPSEYVDEANGIAENGVYTTREAHYLWKPGSVLSTN